MYKIKKVLFNKLFDIHIPYLLGILVEGPRGGLYFLDCFNTGILLDNYFGVRDSETALANRAINESSYKIEKEIICIKYESEKELLTAMRQKYKAVVLNRLDGKETTLKILKKLSL